MSRTDVVRRQAHARFVRRQQSHARLPLVANSCGKPLANIVATSGKLYVVATSGKLLWQTSGEHAACLPVAANVCKPLATISGEQMSLPESSHSVAANLPQTFHFCKGHYEISEINMHSP